MKSIKLGNIYVGDKHPVLVIPEIGINHNGNLDIAKKMIDAAHKAGARLVKHQTHVVDDEMSTAARNVIPGNSHKSIYSIMAECALNEEEELELKEYAENKDIFFLSTPFSRAAADRLERFGVGAYKIGSGEMNNLPLIEHIAEFGKPMIVSTGMNNIKDISTTVNILEKYGVQYGLMHTTNLYPTQPYQIRLGAMMEIMHEFSQVPVGLSDHSLNNNACIAAMGCGAKIVERHFTDSKKRKGPDILCSMNSEELAQLLVAANEVPLMLGGEKKALPEEQVTIDFAFATVVAIKEIKAGERFSKDNIWVKRPGTGEILAAHYEEILGKIAQIDIDKDVHIEWKMMK